ncbi:MAG: hypothetical protein Q4A60_00855 [Pasteurellaceae bacterium]|nr:hypothetical protein [Pasteurellaceae bacterium]
MFSKFFANKKPKIQIGIAENSHYRCWVWQENNRQTIQWQNKQQAPDLLIQRGLFSATFCIIRPIPQAFIWQKQATLVLSENETLYKQILQILHQELPIALADVYFDYHTQIQLEQNLVQVALYAVRKDYANGLLLPCPTILDCENHCYQRGFAYLLPDMPANETGLDVNQIDEDLFPDNTQDKSLYITALGASLWNGKA